MSQPHLSEQEIIRREKLQAMQSAGVDAFPAALYPVTHYSVDIKMALLKKRPRILQLFV